MDRRLKRWELALMLGVLCALTAGVWLGGEREALADSVIRLHVIANSDSASDQAMKLRARDAVLSRAEDILRQAADRPDAQARLRTALPELEQAAFDACGGSYPVRAELTMTEFPLKEYDGFALPAGEYLALRVIIGEGAGRNWWCVVYPPLCTAACTDLEDVAVQAGMDESDMKLITGQEGYVLKFRAVELWERLRQWLGK